MSPKRRNTGAKESEHHAKSVDPENLLVSVGRDNNRVNAEHKEGDMHGICFVFRANGHKVQPMSTAMSHGFRDKPPQAVHRVGSYLTDP